MKERIEAVVEELRSRSGTLRRFDEARIRQGVILRLLDALGWNPYDVKEVWPEYSVERGKVDYALRLDDDTKVFVEAKRPSRKDWDGYQKKLLDYSSDGGVRLAVLTNGLVWWFYLLPSPPGRGEQRKFCAIDIRKRDVSDIANRLVDFLSRENVRSGAAIKNAENVPELISPA